VVNGILADWTKEFESSIVVRSPCRAVAIQSGTAGPEVILPSGAEPFSVVIVATGFGLDSYLDTDSYWTDSRIDGPEAAQEGEWLVSGSGDGALTDLMRLCISRFSHKAVLEAVDQEARKRVGADLLKAAFENLSPIDLADTFERAGQTIAPQLKGKLKSRSIKTWLNSTREELFSPRASVLNRLIVAWLKVEHRFELLSHPGRIGTDSNGDPGEHKNAEIPPGIRQEILRHGPRKGTKFGEIFPQLYENCRDLEVEWRSATQYDDWTRDPLFKPEEFRRETSKVPGLRVDFGNQTGCITIGRSSEPSGVPLGKRVQVVLEGRFGRFAIRSGLDLNPEPVHFPAIDAFHSSARYERTVRALCHSPIAFFDLTGYEPAVLLLLGIRAAVRRGITLTVSEEPRKGRKLPFNIGGLNPIALGSSFSDETYQALVAGFSALKAQPQVYLDLPAYDALRKLGEEHRMVEPDKQILVLRWFDPQYTDMVKSLVDERLRGKFENTTVVTTLDSRSPQLTEQRLYAAIRRTRLCVADWTGWRSNVLFETGVRLAINSTDPILMRCTDKPPGWDDEESEWREEAPPGAEALTDFFKPVHFTLTSEGKLRERLGLVNRKQPPRPQGAFLSQGRTFTVVEESIDRQQEAGAIPVHDILVSEAKSLVGDFLPGEGNSIPVVFPGSLGKQAAKTAIECLMGSWFYLNHRYQLLERRRRNALTTEDHPLLERLEEVFMWIASLNKMYPDDSVRDIAQQITEEMTKDGGQR
jgi:hypothetical protein